MSRIELGTKKKGIHKKPVLEGIWGWVEGVAIFVSVTSEKKGLSVSF
jgi:hypothetical protein